MQNLTMLDLAVPEISLGVVGHVTLTTLLLRDINLSSLCWYLTYPTCVQNLTNLASAVPESTTNSAWLSTVVCSTRLRHTWRISEHRSPISPVGSIYVRQEATSSMFHVTVARSSAVGPSLLRVLWPGTHCQTASEIRRCQPTLSDVIWRLFSSPCTSAPAH